ncbi:CGNR zinc finger domain-containing protein [Streptomyces griseus]|uniref:CGNR zinc finger domain-containing protein n=2 Tax=Streptomyces TaxID=1883 RepID=A0ABU2VW22_9ACTN|nr:CGNR zinc finger domain-containing protein [Streptomyces griseus]MDT0489803.1 CGNR zinc finger domain-containing protein [Streptomyces griseus]
MPHPTGPDPRPLIGEPLALDLLNTRWVDAEGPRDLLESEDGLAIWLGSDLVREHTAPLAPTADHETLTRLLEARTALEALAAATASAPSAAATGRQDSATPAATAATAALNKVLSHGRIRRSLGANGLPESAVEVDDPSWGPAWYAAENWLRLVADRPDRIRACANGTCVLHFFDVSKNGTRRWCSMAGCGNRAKAQRHYARRTGT